MKKIVVVFTGSTGKEIPMLYFGAKVLENMGYEKLLLDCGMSDYENEFYPRVDSIVEELKTYNLHEYDDVIFLSKSVGTIICPIVKERMNLKARLILLTPTKDTLQFIRSDNDVLLTISGNKDKFMVPEELIEICERENVKYKIMDNAGHSLEDKTDVHRSLSLLDEIVSLIESVI